MPKITKSKIVFDGDDWLSDVDYLSTDPNYQRGSINLAKANNFDSVRAYGFAQPGFSPVDAVNIASVSDYLRNGVANGNAAYAISNDGKIQHITGLIGATTIDVAAPFPKTIAGMTPKCSDCVKYYVGASEYFFYSYSTNAFWDVGQYDFAAAFNDTFMSATAASPLAAPYRAGGTGFAHPMIVGDNNIMYMGDRNFVHGFNGQIGANGTFFPAVLTLPQGYVITAFVNYQFYLVIFAYKNPGILGDLSVAKAFFWDTFSSSFTFVKDLNANFVSEAVNYQNTIICFTYGNTSGFYAINAQMQIFDGSIFRILKTGFYDIPIRGGVEVVGDNLYFNAQGSIFAYRGLGNKKSFHELLTKNGQISSGMLKFFSSLPFIHISTGFGASNGLLTFKGLYNSSALVYTKVVELDSPEYLRAQIRSITIVYQKTVSGGRSFKIDYVTDDALTTNLFVAKTTISNTIERYQVNADGSPLKAFKQIQLYLTWDTGVANSAAPSISRIEVEYELVKITNN